MLVGTWGLEESRAGGFLRADHATGRLNSSRAATRALFASTKPNRKSARVAKPGTVTSRPVRRCEAVCLDGETPPRMQGAASCSGRFILWCWSVGKVSAGGFLRAVPVTGRLNSSGSGTPSRFASTKPARKRDGVPKIRTVTSRPVKRCEAVCLDGETPPRMQGAASCWRLVH